MFICVYRNGRCCFVLNTLLKVQLKLTFGIVLEFCLEQETEKVCLTYLRRGCLRYRVCLPHKHSLRRTPTRIAFLGPFYKSIIIVPLIFLFMCNFLIIWDKRIIMMILITWLKKRIYEAQMMLLVI